MQHEIRNWVWSTLNTYEVSIRLTSPVLWIILNAEKDILERGPVEVFPALRDVIYMHIKTTGIECAYVCMQVLMYVCVCVCVHVCMYVCMYVFKL
jgi:hypothetical protein